MNPDKAHNSAQRLGPFIILSVKCSIKYGMAYDLSYTNFK